MDSTPTPKFNKYSSSIENIKDGKVTCNSSNLSILNLNSIIVKELNPKDLTNDTDKVFFKKKELTKMNFGTSGGSVFNNFFGINTPEASIQIFYFATTVQDK